MRAVLRATAYALALGSMVISSGCARKSEVSPLERGRYLVQIGGCNDCHTAGFALKEGKVDESQWLMGDALGWQGPWGTTYPINLRLYVKDMTEDQWLQVVRSLKSRPPMPYYALQEMSDDDLRAIFQFTRSLGAPGEPAPAYLPPGVEAQTPVVRFPMPPGAEAPPEGAAPPTTGQPQA